MSPKSVSSEVSVLILRMACLIPVSEHGLPFVLVNVQYILQIFFSLKDTLTVVRVHLNNPILILITSLKILSKYSHILRFLELGL